MPDTTCPADTPTAAEFGPGHPSCVLPVKFLAACIAVHHHRPDANLAAVAAAVARSWDETASNAGWPQTLREAQARWVQAETERLAAVYGDPFAPAA